VRRELEWVSAFPFDAQLFLRDRWEPYFEEYGLPKTEAEAFGALVRPILNAVGEPYPFVACLVADGDEMGKAIERLASDGHAAHQRVSRTLAGFAKRARGIVEEHRGVLAYAGGDDVLAFVGVPDALRCANALQEAFGAVMKEALGEGDVPRPTLSVGLGVGHVLESLGDLLRFGREAEKEAKKDRNALAVMVNKRGGSRRVWRARWDAEPVARLEKDVALLQERRLSTKKVYQLGDMLRKMPAPNGDAPSESMRIVLAAEANRLLDRNDPGRERTLDKNDLGLDLGGNYASVHHALDCFTERMEIASFLLSTLPRAEEGAS
jgi:CRISPR-associated protein Cmr2